MTRSLLILMLSCSVAMAASGPVPPAQSVAQFVATSHPLYMVVRGFNYGTNAAGQTYVIYSQWSNEIVVSGTAQLSWNAGQNCIGYAISIGNHSGYYTSTFYAGTNTTTPWPCLPAPVRTDLCMGGVSFMAWTNSAPYGYRFFNSYVTTDGKWGVVNDSTDLVNWTNAFAMVAGPTNNALAVVTTQLNPWW